MDASSSIQQIYHAAAPAPAPPSTTSFGPVRLVVLVLRAAFFVAKRLPYSLWAVVLVAGVWQWNVARIDRNRQLLRRFRPNLVNAHGPRQSVPVPASSSSFRASASPFRAPTSSLSRREATSRMPSQQSRVSSYAASPRAGGVNGSGANSPLRATAYSSSLRRQGSNGSFRASPIIPQAAPLSFNPRPVMAEYGSPRAPAFSGMIHSPSIPTLFGREPPRRTLPRLNSFGTNGLPVQAGITSQSARKKRTMDSDDQGRSGKRWKVQQKEFEHERYSDSTREEYQISLTTEMDDEEESIERGGVTRHQKRGARDDDDEDDDEGSRDSDRVVNKRSRRSSPPPSVSRKRNVRSRGGGSDSDSLFDPVDEKRARAGERGKPTTKREIDDVEDSSEEESGDDRAHVRNADSDVDEEEGEESEPVVKSSRKRDSKRSKILDKDTQSLEDQVIMDGTFEDLSTLEHPPPSPPSTQHRRTLPPLSSSKKAKKRTPSNRARRSPSRSEFDISRRVGTEVGDEWVDVEGDKYKIDEEGVKRRLCEVREWRKKYKMPKDSKHPDRDAIHQVVVEKWLTDEEFQQALKERRLAWQDSVTPEVETAVKAEPPTGVEVPKSATRKETGLYHTLGTGSPLRTHSSLSSRSSPSLKRASSSGPSTPLSAGTSPTLTTLLNGRLRLPSGGMSASPARRAWSQAKASRLVEDEQKAMEERERRRRASVLLGGEEVKVAKRKVEEVKTGAKTAVSAASAPPAVPAIPSFFATPTPAPVTSTPQAAPPPTVSSGASLFSMKPSAPSMMAPIPSPAPSAPISAPAVPSLFAPNPAAINVPPTSLPSVFAPPPAKVVPPVAPTSSSSFFSIPTSAPAPLPAFGGAVSSSTSESTTAPSMFGSSSLFGSASKPAETAPKASFSFGAPVQSAPSTLAPPTPQPLLFGATPNPTPFGSNTSLFGSAPRPSIPAPTSTATNAFGFNTVPSVSPAISRAPSPLPAFSNATAAPNPNAFSFAAPSSAAAGPATAFSFGAPPPHQQPPISAAAPPALFSFGANPSPFGIGSTSTAAVGTGAPAFSFGAPAAAPAAFSFGVGASPSAGTGTGDGTAARRRPLRSLPSARKG